MATHRAAVTLGGLAQQDVVDIGVVLWRATRLRHQQHGYQPKRDGAKKSQCSPGPAQRRAIGMQHPVPALPAGKYIRQQHQQCQHTDPFGDHAQPSGKTAQPVGAPVWAAQHMQQQTPVGQGDQGHDQRVDLRAFDLVGKLESRQQCDCRQQTNTRAPQTPPDVPGQHQRRQSRQQRRQQKSNAPIANQLVHRSLHPHQHRWLVGIQLAAAARKQPIARFDHLFGHQRKARLIRRPGVTQPDTRAQHHQGHQHQDPEGALIVAPQGGNRGWWFACHNAGVRPACFFCGRATKTADCGNR